MVNRNQLIRRGFYQSMDQYVTSSIYLHLS
jgi:hypothetical protein